MKKRRKSYVGTKKKTIVVEGKPVEATILVYGELYEDGIIPGVRVQTVGLSRDGQRVLEEGDEVIGISGDIYARTKFFNMGWSICSPQDKFDVNVGISLAKKRFAKYPMYTQSGHFLTDDMIDSIINNELNFIHDHFGKFYCKSETADSAWDKQSDEEHSDEHVHCAESDAEVNTAPEIEGVAHETEGDAQYDKFQKDEYVVSTTEENGEYSLFVAKVRKDLGKEFLAYWSLMYTGTKDGSFVRSISSGSDLKLPKKGWRVATPKEVEMIMRLPDFNKKFIS